VGYSSVVVTGQRSAVEPFGVTWSERLIHAKTIVTKTGLA